MLVSVIEPHLDHYDEEKPYSILRVPQGDFAKQFVGGGRKAFAAGLWRTSSSLKTLQVSGTYPFDEALLDQTEHCVSQAFARNVDVFLEQCNGRSRMENEQTTVSCFPVTFHHPGLLELLREEKFDAAISEFMDYCALREKKNNCYHDEEASQRCSRQWE